MIGKTLYNIALVLGERLDWLDRAFGQSQKLYNADQLTFPAYYDDNGEYISLLPDDIRGNYLFFELLNPYKIQPNFKNSFLYDFNTDLVVWFNTDDVSARVNISSEFARDFVRDSIVNALANKYHKGATIKIVSFAEVDIFNPYTKAKQLDTQYLMAPYSGLKININVKEKCVC